MRQGAAWFALAAAVPLSAAALPSWEAPPAVQAAARSDYIEHCGGCHGVAGSSAPARVPELRGRVGWFLCTTEGRDYLIRLPNVAHAPIDDPEALAALVNYVVFRLGGESAPAGARAFDGAEVAVLRRSPIVRASLLRERARLVADIRRRCPAAPASLADYSG
ncbi:cytochrome C [Sphingomonas spermidinifaciens]|uniref:Cytochrome C n=1 Tax=Sphingomonas spermidinifaciens TaxID=1141889 RepID=A0A2A4B2Y1_9SPHN|nr:cytochrome C [Sphingomonas spermidinifaciens]PCD02088.1 cytochrome C [Sphingomonas spermidinifaciens]